MSDFNNKSPFSPAGVLRGHPRMRGKPGGLSGTFQLYDVLNLDTEKLIRHSADVYTVPAKCQRRIRILLVAIDGNSIHTLRQK